MYVWVPVIERPREKLKKESTRQEMQEMNEYDSGTMAPESKEGARKRYSKPEIRDKD